VKKYKSLITSSLIAAIIISVPIASFAESNNNDTSNKKTEHSNVIKLDKNQKMNFQFGSNWFNKHNSKDTTIPVISNVITTSNKTSKATISWKTDIKSNSFIWYSKTSGIDTSINPTIKQNSKVLNHKINIKKLEPNTKYYVVVGSANGVGIIKSSETSFTTPATTIITPVVDTTAPVISDKEVTINASSVTISWKTNEPSNSKVFYTISINPLDINSSATASVSDGKLVKNHSLSIPLLTPNTLYHFILKSIDAKNNGTVSSESSFMTSSL